MISYYNAKKGVTKKTPHTKGGKEDLFSSRFALSVYLKKLGYRLGESSIKDTKEIKIKTEKYLIHRISHMEYTLTKL